MQVLTRKVAAPVVVGVWAIALLVGAHTVAVLPWFTDYYDFYSRQPGLRHATLTTGFRYGYPIGAALALAAILAGTWFVRRRECHAVSLMWFAATSLVTSIAWFVWTLLAERSIYVLSLPA